MDRKSIIGFFLIAIILVVFSVINAPKKSDKVTPAPANTEKSVTQPETLQTVSDSSNLAVNSKPDTIINDTTQNQAPALFKPFFNGKNEVISIETDLLKLQFSTLGGRIGYAELVKFKTFDQKPLVLFDSSESEFGYEFPYESYIVNSKELYFTTSNGNKKITGSDSIVITMALKIDNSHFIEHIYTIHGNDYMIGFRMNIVGFNNLIPKNTAYIDINWNAKLRHLERKLTGKNTQFNTNITSVFYQLTDEDADKLSIKKDNVKDLSGNIKWVAFKQDFFSQTLINKGNFIRGRLELISDSTNTYQKFMKSTLTVPYDHKSTESYSFNYYFGPCHYKTLKHYHQNLEQQVILGKNIIRWVNVGIIIPAFNFLSRYSSNFGLIIFLLTIYIKIILLPLTYRSYLSQARMKLLKPEIDLLKEKVGKDQLKLQQEQMKLYKSAGVSPLGGCLPMLLQLPILIAMFRFFPSSIELRQESFLWATDLSTYDSIWNFPNGFRIPGYGDHVSLFTLLMTISTLIYTKMNSDMMTGDQAKQMKIIQYIMPILFLGFFNNYSAGLSYYYFLANVLTFGQQYLFKLFINEDKLRKQIEMNKQKKTSKPKSKWMQRLEELQKQQQSASRKR